MSLNITGIVESGKILTLSQNVTLTETLSLNSYSKLDLAGFTLTGPASAYALEVTDGSKVEICNGTLVTENRGVYAAGGSSVILGDKFVFEGKMRSAGIYDGSKLFVKSGASLTTLGGDGGIFVCGDLTAGKVEGSRKSYVEVEGKVVNTATYCAIQGNGNDKTGCDLVIKSPAEITATGSAVYFPCPGILRIEGGSITGDTAVYVKSGTLQITGGTLTGNGEKVEYTPNPNGNNATGDAVVIDSCNYPSGAPAVEITGGTFVSKNAEAVGSYADGDEGVATGFIKGGSFSPAVSSDLVSEGTVTVGGSIVEIQYLSIDFSSHQNSVPNEDGSSVLTTYLDAHVSYKVPGFMTGSAVVELQELTKVTLTPEGLKTSLVTTPVEYKNVDEVYAAIGEKVSAFILSEQTSRQERMFAKESLAKMKVLGL